MHRASLFKQSLYIIEARASIENFCGDAVVFKEMDYRDMIVSMIVIRYLRYHSYSTSKHDIKLKTNIYLNFAPHKNP